MFHLDDGEHCPLCLCFVCQTLLCSLCVLVSCQSLTANKRTNWKVMSGCLFYFEILQNKKLLQRLGRVQLLTETNRGFILCRLVCKWNQLRFRAVWDWSLYLFLSQRIIMCRREPSGKRLSCHRLPGRGRVVIVWGPTMILCWQPFVSAARHDNVAFATGGSYKVMAQCDCHTPWGPNTMWQGNGAQPQTSPGSYCLTFSLQCWFISLDFE